MDQNTNCSKQNDNSNYDNETVHKNTQNNNAPQDDNEMTEEISKTSEGAVSDTCLTADEVQTEQKINDDKVNVNTDSDDFKVNDDKVNDNTDSEDSSSEEEYESADEGEIEIEEEKLKLEEEKLTEEEKNLKKAEAQKYKDEGNKVFKDGFYKEAIKYYSRALHTCPYSYFKERSIMYSNRAACKLHMEKYDEAIKDCSKAIDLHPHYLKAVLRRAELYEKVEKLEEALADYQRMIELDPSHYIARAACMRLPDQIKEKNEKMKEEMMGKLKDLGNMVLKPFGLSTNNFKMQQDPKTGGYSVNFQQNPES
ncbi:Tetratricopeptide repeat protein 1 [Mytilus edulis]|uniref:Tetratricopeptide repeat protein 1 n=1 Tax=Mytilus edulis TaxID=6550 RepID=A0A8S3T652_MYTED|nr:Tetratricopeptide repeat protein 1 [Mytilus edulis]